ncbi:MAG TPA: hypothetical protein VE398_05415 [Acidobacteriota bacterium]|nr:hypothetical protein [Acidobacteriota bacterium]
MVIVEAGATIEVVGPGIGVGDFEMRRAEAERVSGIFDGGDGAAPPAATAGRGGEEELVNESIAAAILEALAEDNNDVGDRSGAIEDEPEAAE